MTNNDNENDLMSFLTGASIVKEDNNVEIERSDESVAEDLERERELAEARKLFDTGGFTYDNYLNDDGTVEIGIYGKTSKGTPLHVLMEMCEADLPYVDKETRRDYENYKEEFQVEEIPYDVLAREQEELDDF